jgi:hypothetical protein
MTCTITVDSTVVASDEQVSCDLAGETVILNHKDSIYYGLDEVGTSVWSFIQEPRRVAEIRDSVLREYHVEADRCERDVIALVEKLAERGLVEVRNADA